MEVKIIDLRGESALVEAPDLRRVILPLDTIQDGQVDAEDWEMGIPYGLPWEEMLTITATPQALAYELRKNGIYTYADLEANPQAAMGCIVKVYGVELSTLFQAAHERR